VRRATPAALLAACALICLAVPASALAGKHPTRKTAPSYYLALGDSLAAGAQPNASGKTVPTDQGYANDLFATEKSKLKGLKLKDLGCLGETTSSMLAGGPFCPYAGAQLADAVKFVKTHKVVLVTLDIGANDVDPCGFMPPSQLAACVGTGLKSINNNVPKIVKKLRNAAGRKVRIMGMTYYDPFLADFLGTTVQQPLATASVGLAKTLNAALTAAFKAQQLKIADVATAFDTYTPFTSTTTLAGHGTVPLAVAQICKFTWMCAPAPRGPNIHATATGYQKMARVFAAKL
jgi:lysophospholipase L1-like esterase